MKDPSQCAWCPNPRGERSLCPPCLKKAKDRARARSERFRIQGTCQYCGKNPNLPGIFHCQKCKEYFLKKRNDTIKERIAKGLCACGKPKASKSKTYWCEVCLKRFREYEHTRTKMRIAAGLCPRCGKKAEKGCQMCTVCRIKRLKAVRAYHDRQRAKK